MSIRNFIATLPIALLFASAALAACPREIDPAASKTLAAATAQNNCRTPEHQGYLLPDPSCTPGATNPTVTLVVLRNPSFRVRDKATTAAQKAVTYDAYDEKHPSNNRGSHQVCEMDHLVSLELGGADTLDNI